jgi:hypothetical protein
MRLPANREGPVFVFTSIVVNVINNQCCSAWFFHAQCPLYSGAIIEQTRCSKADFETYETLQTKASLQKVTDKAIHSYEFSHGCQLRYARVFGFGDTLHSNFINDGTRTTG